MRHTLLLLIALAPAMFARDHYLFTSFRGNGESGIFLAESKDGKTWIPANRNQPILVPSEPGMLMRDPWLGRGPDGVWHMLWTWGWTKSAQPWDTLKLGHASSRDLRTWSAQQAIPVLAQEPRARNAWAPEAVYSARTKQWRIFWATTIGDAKADYDHRIFSITTGDWAHFTPAEPYFDPGFSAIDSTIVPMGKQWLMVFKDERKPPAGKRLRLAWANDLAGPWTRVSEPFTEPWIEGPTVLKIGAWWWIYFDHYTKPQHYGAMRTRNWRDFEEITAAVHFPPGQRHGTAVKR